MPEHPNSQDPHQRQQPFAGDLPRYPGGAEDGARPRLPDRAKAAAKYGLIWGGFCGGILGTINLLFWLWGSPSLDEAFSAFGVFVGCPLVFGVLGGITWGIRGAVRDSLMAHRDREKQREAEHKEDQDREWHAVKQILQDRKENSEGSGKCLATDARPPKSTTGTGTDFCYLCGEHLGAPEPGSRLCRSCRQ